MRTARVRLLALVAFAGLLLAACGDTPANDVEVGACTNDDLSGQIGEIGTVSCDDEHTAQVFAKFDVEGDDFPGAEELGAETIEGCQGNRFEEFVGTDYPSSIYIAEGLAPSESSWDNGDRTIICFILGTTDGAPLEGSAENSNV